MPRKAGNSTPKYRKHKATGQAVVTINGRDHYLGRHGSAASKQEYDRRIAEWLRSDRSVEVEDDLTVMELMAAYLRHAKAYYRTATHTEYENIKLSLRPVKRLYGRTAAAEFGPLSLKTVQRAMVDDGLARKTTNSRIGKVKRMFKWAVAEELVPADVFHGLQAVEGLRKGYTDARESEPVRPVDAAVVDATLTKLPAVVADMVRLQRLTGCRPSELCMMRPMDVDRSGEVWIYSPESHKTANKGHDRSILIGPKGQAILRPYLLREESAYCFSPRDSERKRLADRHAARKTPMSCGNRPGTNRKRKRTLAPGDRYTRDSYRRAIHRAADLAKVERWSPHRLRHSAGTDVRKQYGLEAAQVYLGHKEAKVTQHYAERDLALAAKVAREVG